MLMLIYSIVVMPLIILLFFFSFHISFFFYFKLMKKEINNHLHCYSERLRHICVHLFPIAYCSLYWLFWLEIFFHIRKRKIAQPNIYHIKCDNISLQHGFHLSPHKALGNIEEERYYETLYNFKLIDFTESC